MRYEIPRDIEDAAMIDGLSRLGAFVKVIVPISSAGILTVVIFTLTLVMQEFVYGLTLITSSSSYAVSVGVPTFLVRGDVYFWGSLSRPTIKRFSSIWPKHVLAGVCVRTMTCGGIFGGISRCRSH